MAHFSREELTQTRSGGCFSKNALRVLLSKNVNFKNIATFLPGGMIANAFSTNSSA